MLTMISGVAMKGMYRSLHGENTPGSRSMSLDGRGRLDRLNYSQNGDAAEISFGRVVA